MTTYYTTPDKVASFLGVSAFTGTDQPSGVNTLAGTTEVESWINWAEDEIDRKTGHSWRSTLVEDEIYDIDQPYWDARFWYGRELPLFLHKRNLRTFVSGTHKIEIYEGAGNWVDLVANFTEGRNQDYWIDYKKGKIWFGNKRPLFRRSGVRMTYAYGESNVPKDIEQCATLLTAVVMADSDNFRDFFVEGSNVQIPLQNKVARWEKKAKSLILGRAEILGI